MIRTLCWKEYREQRDGWLLMAFVAVSVVVATGLSLAQEGVTSLRTDENLSVLLSLLLLGMACIYGVICGANLLAGEREARTLEFLDLQLGQRGPLWKAKLFAGASLCLAQALLLFGLALTLGIHAHALALLAFLPLVVLDGLFWGLFGSALSRSSFKAILVGMTLAIASWLAALHPIGYHPEQPLIIFGSRLLLSGIALAVSAHVFCSRDRRKKIEVQATRVSSWLSLFWLTARQGWVEAILVLAASSIAGPLLARLHPLAWLGWIPVLGTVCGAAVFGEDQVGNRCRFLSERRLPPSQVWLVKTLCWLAWAWVTVLFVVIGVFVLLTLTNSEIFFRSQRGLGFPDSARWDHVFLGADLVVVLAFLVLQGFTIGLLTGMILPRWRGLTEVVAIAFAALAAAAWLPSFLYSGLPAWQLLMPPLFLLVASRILYWPCVTQRLQSWRAVATLIGAILLAVLWSAGLIWYQLTQIPNLGEPFDRTAFEKSLNALRASDASSLIHQAAKELAKERERILARMTPVPQPFAMELGMEAIEAEQPSLALKISLQLHDVTQNGWSGREAELGQFLDAIFAEKAMSTFREAAESPPGQVQDPRLMHAGSTAEYVEESQKAARLLVARALQLQARGDDEAALDHLLTLLALSRQFGNKTVLFLYRTARNFERMALDGMEIWLKRIGPRRALLSRALVELTKHEAEKAPVSDSVKAEYYLFRNSLERLANWNSVFRTTPYTLARELPWGKEREERLVNLIFANLLQSADTPYWEREKALDFSRDRERVPWLKAADRTPLAPLMPRWNDHSLALASCELRAMRLQLALALYAIDAGKPATRLEDLVPRYVKELPVDPFSGKPFGYRVSPGERLETFESEEVERALLVARSIVGVAASQGDAGARDVRLIQELTGMAAKGLPNEVSPGQGILWSTGPDRIDHGGKRTWPTQVHPVLASWDTQGRDLIYVLPRWTK